MMSEKSTDAYIQISTFKSLIAVMSVKRKKKPPQTSLNLFKANIKLTVYKPSLYSNFMIFYAWNV